MNVKQLALAAILAALAAGLAGMSTSGAGAEVVKAPVHATAAGHHADPDPSPPTHGE